jgi:hypothetical protein
MSGKHPQRKTRLHPYTTTTKPGRHPPKTRKHKFEDIHTWDSRIGNHISRSVTGGDGFRLAIIGSRRFESLEHYEVLKEHANKIAKNEGLVYGTVVSGGAKGADTLAMRYADEHSITKDEKKPKGWGNGFLFARNTDIAKESDGVLAFPDKGALDNNQGGTLDTITKANALGKPVYVVPVDFASCWDR